MSTTRILIGHKHSVLRVTARYLSGRSLDGIARTDARFLTPATRALTQTGHASRWASRPGAYRLAWRLGIPAALTASGMAYAADAIATEATAGAMALTGGTLATRKAVRTIKGRHHTAKYVRPLAGTLIRQLGMPDTTPFTKVVDIPTGFRTPNYKHDTETSIDTDELEDGTIRVFLPTFHVDSMATRMEILRTVTGRLGLNVDDLDQKWKFVGNAPEAQFRVAPRPPNKVTLNHVTDAMLNAKESAPILGIGRRGKLISVDLDSESPHILISASTGAGKSVQTRTICVQLMRNGAQLIVLDLKRQSHRWAKDLPNVTYRRDIADIHDQLIAVAAEGQRRNVKTDDIDDDVDTEQLAALLGPRVVIVVEEINATINKLQEYWAEIREKSDPKSSPAVKALAEILFMGRAVRINVIAIGQLITARALGGPEARECFTTRILSRFSMNAAKMLVPEITPPPKSSRHPGRVQVCMNGVAYETQVTFLTDKQARQWATAGPITVPVTLETGTVAPQDIVSPTRYYSLADAARQEWCTHTPESLRKLKQRSSDFPAGRKRGKRVVWTQEELTTYLSRIKTEVS